MVFDGVGPQQTQGIGRESSCNQNIMQGKQTHHTVRYCMKEARTISKFPGSKRTNHTKEKNSRHIILTMDMQQQQQQRQRRRRILPTALLVVAFTASIGYSIVWKNDANDDRYTRRHHHASSLQNHRQLLKTLDADGLMSTFDKNSLLTNTNHEGEAAAASSALAKNDQDLPTSRRNGTYHRKRQLHTSSFGPLIQPYTLHDAIHESTIWEHTFAIIVYDPKDDTFIGHYSSNHKDNPSCKKLWSSMISFISMLRTNFPSRFSKQQKQLYNKDVDEMVFVSGSGDYPHLKLNSLPYKTGVAPVLMFGSVFQQSNQLYPNLLAMPMPGLHLGCFEEFSKWGRVCGSFRSIHSGVSSMKDRVCLCLCMDTF